jgi:hypothetical protein
MPPGFSCVNLKEKIARKRFINTEKESTLMQLKSFAIPASYKQTPISCLRLRQLLKRGESKGILIGHAPPAPKII